MQPDSSKVFASLRTTRGYSMTVPTVQQADPLSPPLQVLLLQMLSMVVSKINRTAPVPGLGDVFVGDRAQLTAIQLSVNELSQKFDQQHGNHSTIAELQGLVDELTKEKERQLEEFKKNLDEERKLRVQFEEEKKNETEELTNALENERKLRIQLEEKTRLCQELAKAPVSTDIFLAAAKAGNDSKVKAWVAAGVDVNATDGEGMTALHLAADNGHTETVRVLAAAGVALDAKNKDGLTALFLAASKGLTETVRVLTAAGADVNAHFGNGWTALHSAADTGYADMVRVLASAGADVDAKIHTTGWTALHWAAERGRPEAVRALSAAGADVNAIANNGESPLSNAALRGHVLLLDAGAGVDVGRSSGGYTPMLAAAHENHFEVFRMLVSAGAYVNSVTSDRRAALHIAVAHRRADMVRLLLQYRADRNLTNRYGATPLALARSYGYTDLVALLS